MSAKGNKSESDPLDRYFTPKWCVDLCRRHIIEPHYSDVPIEYILEPSAGEGVWVRGMREQYPDADISALDLDWTLGPWPEANESYEGDFLDTDFNDVGSWDLVIGNPPYTFAQEFVTESLRLTGNVIYLLRQGFLASSERAPFFRKNPPDLVFILPNRPAFIAGKSSGDSSDYAFICWKKGPHTKTEMRWLPTVPLAVRRGEVDFSG